MEVHGCTYYWVWLLASPWPGCPSQCPLYSPGGYSFCVPPDLALCYSVTTYVRVSEQCITWPHTWPHTYWTSQLELYSCSAGDCLSPHCLSEIDPFCMQLSQHPQTQSICSFCCPWTFVVTSAGLVGSILQHVLRPYACRSLHTVHTWE